MCVAAIRTCKAGSADVLRKVRHHLVQQNQAVPITGHPKFVGVRNAALVLVRNHHARRVCARARINQLFSIAWATAVSKTSSSRRSILWAPGPCPSFAADQAKKKSEACRALGSPKPMSVTLLVASKSILVFAPSLVIVMSTMLVKP